MKRTLAILISSLVLAQGASAAGPGFERVDSNGDNLVSLEELLHFVEGADITDFTAHDRNANAFLEPEEFEALMRDLD